MNSDTQAAWRCFHCDECFTDREAAAEHFGTTLAHQPACQIDIAEYRRMEEISRRHCEEDTDLHRQVLSAKVDGEQAAIRAEEKGYARGLEDAKKHPAELGLMPAGALPAGGEPVYWESRWKDTHPQTVTSGQWYPWERVKPQGLQTLEDRLAEFRGWIAQGQHYELRALFAAPQPAQEPLTGNANEQSDLLRELFTLEAKPLVWKGSKAHHLSFSGGTEYRCSDCDENAWSHAEIVHNKGCSYFSHMERIARMVAIREKLRDLVGIKPKN